MAIRAYNSPGVTVTETIDPALTPLIANPSEICLVGPAQGYQVASERVYLSGTTPVSLRYTGVNTATVIVYNNTTGAVINPGNYTVLAGTDPDPTRSGDIPYTITRIPGPEGSGATPGVAAGTGTLTGTFVYAYSYVNANGESGLSPQSTSITLTAQGTNLTNITVGPAGTTARNIYRAPISAGTQGPWSLVGSLPNNTATTLSGETAAASATLPQNGIASGDTVLVTYQFTDQFYFEPTLFSDFDDIVQKYGTPFNTDGTINSALSFAAMLAFQNGASEMVALASATSSDTDISNAFPKLEADDSIQLIVPVSGGASVHSSLAAHLTSMNSQGHYRMGVVGRDSSTTPITSQALRDSQLYNNEALMMISPASFKFNNPITGRPATVGGQYAASAVAGMFAARDVNVPLTRKTLAGFTGVGDKRTNTEKALDSSAGLMEIEERNGVLRVRHGITTAIGNVNTREASVVRTKYDMGHRLLNTLDGLIGIVATVDQAPTIVTSVVHGVLEQMVMEGLISKYANIKARLLASDLTTVEVRFQYTPAYPINNIAVIFTINTQTGNATLDSGTTSDTGGIG